MRPCRLIAALWFAAQPILVAAETCDPPPPAAREIDRAVSLKGLEAELAACGADIACRQDAASLYDLTSIDGFLIDADTRDIVLVGHRDPDGVPLVLDDFVVMLRNALNHYARREGNTIYYTAPGVSLDPRPEVIARLQELSAAPGGLDAYVEEWPKFCQTPQDVRILGLPASRAAAVMLDADYRMKRFVNGQVSPDLPDYASLSDLTLEAARIAALSGEQSAPIGGLTRFWFAAGTHEVGVDDGVYMLETANVILLDEAELLTGKGEIVAAAETNPLAREFTCAFSRNYRTIAALPDHRVYADLEAIFRWGALARLLVDENAFARAGYRPDRLIDDFAVAEPEMPPTLDGISNIRRWPTPDDPEYSTQPVRLALPSCGGVTVDQARIAESLVPDMSGQLEHLGAIVLYYRPSLLQAFWDVFL